MLIILSGTETINKRLLARQIMSTLNTFNVDGYSVNFNSPGSAFEVKDPSGKIVYNKDTTDLLVDNDNEGQRNEEGNIIFDKIIALENEVFTEGTKVNHFKNVFVDTLYDFGVTTVLDYGHTYENNSTNTHLSPHSFNDVISNYRNRQCETFVITGAFSKAFIDLVRAELGTENVKVLNIVRNPSASFLIHRAQADFYEETTLTPEQDQEKFEQSLANAASLRRFSDIETLYFEEILSQQKLVVNGVDVSLPPGYEAADENFTAFEKEALLPLDLKTDEDLAKFNERIDHYATSLTEHTSDDLPFLSELNTALGTNYTSQEMEARFKENLPSSLFTALGYIAMDKNEMI